MGARRHEAGPATDRADQAEDDEDNEDNEDNRLRARATQRTGANDGLELVLRWFLNDMRGKFPDSPVPSLDESGGQPHRSTIHNRRRRLMEREVRPATE